MITVVLILQAIAVIAVSAASIITSVKVARLKWQLDNFTRKRQTDDDLCAQAEIHRSFSMVSSDASPVFRRQNRCPR